MLDSAHKVCRIDLQAKVKPAGEARVIHHPRLRRAQVLRPDPREIQPIRGGGHGKPQCLAIQTTARVHVITDENDLLHLFDLDRVHGLLPPNVLVSEDGHDFLHVRASSVSR
jgi:hypothetical protein